MCTRLEWQAVFSSFCNKKINILLDVNFLVNNPGHCQLPGHSPPSSINYFNSNNLH